MNPSRISSSRLLLPPVQGPALAAGCCLLSVVCCLLSVVCCLLSVVCCLLSVVCCLLDVGCCLLDVGCWILNAEKIKPLRASAIFAILVVNQQRSLPLCALALIKPGFPACLSDSRQFAKFADQLGQSRRTSSRTTSKFGAAKPIPGAGTRCSRKLGGMCLWCGNVAASAGISGCSHGSYQQTFSPSR